MTGRQAFVPELTVCFCIALLVALAAAPAARSQDDRTAFQERFNRGVSAAKSAKEKVDRAKDLKEQTWDRLPKEGQDLAKEAAKEGAGKGWEKVKQSKTLGKAAKRAEKAVKPLAKKATKFVAKKANPVVGAFSTGYDVGTVIEGQLPEEASLWIGERVAKNIVYPLTGDRDAEPSPLPGDVSAGGPDALDRDIARLREEKERLDEQYRQWDAGSGDGSDSWGDEGRHLGADGHAVDRPGGGLGTGSGVGRLAGRRRRLGRRRVGPGTGRRDALGRRKHLYGGQHSGLRRPDGGAAAGGGREEERGRGSAENTGDRRGAPAAGGRASGSGTGAAAGGRRGSGAASARGQASVGGARTPRAGKGEPEEGTGIPGTSGGGAAERPHGGRAGPSGEGGSRAAQEDLDGSGQHHSDGSRAHSGRQVGHRPLLDSRSDSIRFTRCLGRGSARHADIQSNDGIERRVRDFDGIGTTEPKLRDQGTIPDRGFPTSGCVDVPSARCTASNERSRSLERLAFRSRYPDRVVRVTRRT